MRGVHLFVSIIHCFHHIFYTISQFGQLIPSLTADDFTNLVSINTIGSSAVWSSIIYFVNRIPIICDHHQDISINKSTLVFAHLYTIIYV